MRRSSTSYTHIAADAAVPGSPAATAPPSLPTVVATSGCEASIAAQNSVETAVRDRRGNTIGWVDRGVQEGSRLGVWNRQERPRAAPDAHLPVLHKLMAKFLQEDENRDVFLVGTIIQNTCGATSERLAADDGGFEGSQFQFRFNDVTATDEQVELRRTVPVNEFGLRSTYNVKIPLRKRRVYAMAPFEIIECSAMIELSTSARTHSDGTSQIRPNMLVSQEDCREQVLIRNEHELDDGLDTFETLSVTPHVEMMWDGKKRYCPKYEVKFYLETPMRFGLISVGMPLLLVMVLTVLNVFAGYGGGGPDLGNSIALALTIVFVLPQLAPPGSDMINGRGWGLNDKFITSFMVGCTFCSMNWPTFEEIDASCDTFPHANVNTWLNVFGMVVGLMAFVFPLINLLRYRALCRRIKGGSKPAPGNKQLCEAELPGRQTAPKLFVSDKTFRKVDALFDDKKQRLDAGYLGNFMPISELFDQLLEHHDEGPSRSGWRVKMGAKYPKSFSLVAGPEPVLSEGKRGLCGV